MNFVKATPEFEILLIEDNLGDVELAKEAFKESKNIKNIHVVRDGEEALDFLYHNSVFTSVPRPHLILMDLNMPKKNGKELLTIIKEDEELKDIPVIVFTSSEADSDIMKSYKLHANAYIVKPPDIEQYFNVMRSLENFWMVSANLPTGMKIQQ